MRGWRTRFTTVAIAGLVAAGTWLGTGRDAAAGANTVLVFDASNSMNSPFEGGTRIEALKAALAASAPGIDSAIDLGLVVFGSREAQSCADIDTLVAAEPGGAARTASAAEAITAMGVSAVPQSLQAAADAAQYRKRAASIVLVADTLGVNSCGDPCAVAAALAQDGVDIKVHTIAIAPKPDELAGLQCIATETGGTFAAVSSRSQLIGALNTAFASAAAQEQTEVKLAIVSPRPKPVPKIPLVERPPRPKPVPITGAEPAEEEGAAAEDVPTAQPNVSVFAPTGAATGSADEDGSDSSSAADDSREARESVMAPSVVARVESAAKADRPAAIPEMAPETTPPSDDTADIAQSTVSPSDETAPPPAAMPDADAKPRTLAGSGTDDSADFDATMSQTLPAPDGTTILVRRQAAPAQTEAMEASEPSAPVEESEETPQVTAAVGSPLLGPDPVEALLSGETVTGRARLSAYIVAGTKPVPSGMLWQVLEARDGSTGDLVARSAEARPLVELPPGDYMVRGVFGNAAKVIPIKVEANETSEADLVLDAGGLQIIAVNAGNEDHGAVVRNTIYAEGDATHPVVRDADSGEIVYLTAGTYRVESRLGNANALAVADIKVQAGKLVKAKINHRAGPVAFRLLAEGGDTPLDGAVWQVLSSDGRVITQSREKTPSYVFAEGAYDLVVQHDGKTYRSSFEIKPGQPTEVDIVAR